MMTDTTVTDTPLAFAVLIAKSTGGGKILFSRYATKNAAESAAAALRALLLTAKVVPAAGLPARPGASITGPARGRRKTENGNP